MGSSLRDAAKSFADLFGCGGSRRADLLDGDRRDEVADGGGFQFHRAGEQRGDDAAGGGVAGTNDVDRAGRGVAGDERRRLVGPRDEDAAFAGRAKRGAAGARGQPLGRDRRRLVPFVRQADRVRHFAAVAF